MSAREWVPVKISPLSYRVGGQGYENYRSAEHCAQVRCFPQRKQHPQRPKCSLKQGEEADLRRGQIAQARHEEAEGERHHYNAHNKSYHGL